MLPPRYWHQLATIALEISDAGFHGTAEDSELARMVHSTVNLNLDIPSGQSQEELMRQLLDEASNAGVQALQMVLAVTHGIVWRDHGEQAARNLFGELRDILAWVDDHTDEEIQQRLREMDDRPDT